MRSLAEGSPQFRIVVRLACPWATVAMSMGAGTLPKSLPPRLRQPMRPRPLLSGWSRWLGLWSPSPYPRRCHGAGARRPGSSWETPPLRTTTTGPRSVNDLVGVTAVGEDGAQALVLADEPVTSCYLPEHRAFLRWLAADSAGPVKLMDSAAGAHRVRRPGSSSTRRVRRRARPLGCCRYRSGRATGCSRRA